MKLSNLKVNPDNPQKFTRDEIEPLKRSLEEFPKMLELRPLVYDPKTMYVLGGNKRLICLQELGKKEIPDSWALAADKFTEAEKQRFIIADNVGFGSWDMEKLELWDTKELEEWGVNKFMYEKFDGNIDDFFEENNEPEKEKELICPHCGLNIYNNKPSEKNEE